MGDGALAPSPNPQSPIPNPQSPIPNPQWNRINHYINKIFNLNIIKNNKAIYE
jgi:hypothetical protein